MSMNNGARVRSHSKRAFTLIELSIVLVIIGLLVGGVLVGADLIKSAEVRSQITQIEKYNTAVNTFKGKYGELPGDMSPSTAATFGFAPRGTVQSTGDGNGIIEGVGWFGSAGNFPGGFYAAGETVMFWSDLTYANGNGINLIDGSFSSANPANGGAGNLSATQIGSYFPVAKIGYGNFIIVSSAFGINYFSIRPVSSMQLGWLAYSTNSGPSGWEGLTVRQAYDMDKKIDDGSPQTGAVIAVTISGGGGGVGQTWAGAWSQWPGSYGGYHGTINTNSLSPNLTTCFDNGGTGGSTQQYSLSQNNGAGVNCALSFKFQ